MNLSKRTKTSLIFLGIITILSTFFGIGYAQISAVDLVVSGTASIKKQEGIMITKVAYFNGINVDNKLSTINDFYQTTMDSTIVVSNDSASTITYQVTIQNTFKEDYTFAGVVYDPNFYDNPSIIYEISGINIGDKIEAKETKTLMITFMYNGKNISNNTLNSFLNFKFQKEELIPTSDIQNAIEENQVLSTKEEITSEQTQ